MVWCTDAPDDGLRQGQSLSQKVSYGLVRHCQSCESLAVQLASSVAEPWTAAAEGCSWHFLAALVRCGLWAWREAPAAAAGRAWCGSGGNSRGGIQRVGSSNVIRAARGRRAAHPSEIQKVLLRCSRLPGSRTAIPPNHGGEHDRQEKSARYRPDKLSEDAVREDFLM